MYVRRDRDKKPSSLGSESSGGLARILSTQFLEVPAYRWSQCSGGFLGTIVACLRRDKREGGRWGQKPAFIADREGRRKFDNFDKIALNHLTECEKRAAI